jgi:hypothetical protein
VTTLSSAPVPELDDEPTGPTGPPPGDLIGTKAWDLLGMTRDEFTRAWYARAFDGDPRPEVAALDQLMRTGRWDPA